MAERNTFRSAVRRKLLMLLTIALFSFAACSETPESETETVESAESAGANLTNCGVDISIERPPERVFTIKSSTLELMLALGLEDSVIGSAYLDGPVPDELSPDEWEPNVVAEQIPSREVFLSTEPEFVLAGWESNVSAEGIGEREELRGLGITSYVLPPACEFGDDVKQAVTFEDIFGMIDEIGTIFDAEPAAEEIISAQKARLAGIQPFEENVDILWYSSGSEAPFVAGATGTPQMIMEAAGVTNVFEDVARSWFSISWEGFINEEPDFIVLVDAPWNSAQDKRERLESHPAASQLEAVEDQRYIAIPFAATEAGVRNIDAVELLAGAVTEAQAEQ